MHTLPIDEVSAVLDRLEAILRESGELTLTRGGVPVARIVPVGSARPVPSRRSLRASMPRLETPSEELIRQDREAR